jgi:AAA+ ATPase superfamily predicted ATPase
MLDDEVVKKIRRIQSMMILEKQRSVSLSSLVNKILKENL